MNKNYIKICIVDTYISKDRETQFSENLDNNFQFKVLGLREKIGKMTYGPYVNQWIDNTYMERRSSKFQD